MKNSQLTTILMAVTGVSAIASVILCIMLIKNTRELRNSQPELAIIQQNRAIATSLIGELTEYGKKSPAIQPILQSIMPRQPQPQPAVRK